MIDKPIMTNVLQICDLVCKISYTLFNGLNIFQKLFSAGKWTWVGGSRSFTGPAFCLSIVGSYIRTYAFSYCLCLDHIYAPLKGPWMIPSVFYGLLCLQLLLMSSRVKAAMKSGFRSSNDCGDLQYQILRCA